MDPKATQARIEKLKTTRDEARAAKADLERQRPTDDAAKREVENKIKEADRKIEEVERERPTVEKEVEEATKRINDRVYEWTYCRDYRQNVEQVFDSAMRKADGETDAAIYQLAKELVSLLGKTVPGHREQITGVSNALQTCKDMLDDIGRLGRISLAPAPRPNGPMTSSVLLATTCRYSQLGFGESEGSVD